MYAGNELLRSYGDELLQSYELKYMLPMSYECKIANIL